MATQKLPLPYAKDYTFDETALGRQPLTYCSQLH